MSTQKTNKTIDSLVESWLNAKKNENPARRDICLNEQISHLLRLFAKLQEHIANEEKGGKEFQTEIKKNIGEISLRTLLLFNILTGLKFPFQEKENPVEGFSPNGFTNRLFMELAKIKETREKEIRASDKSDYTKSLGIILNLVSRYAKNNTTTLSDCISLVAS